MYLGMFAVLFNTNGECAHEALSEEDDYQELLKPGSPIYTAIKDTLNRRLVYRRFFANYVKEPDDSGELSPEATASACFSPLMPNMTSPYM